MASVRPLFNLIKTGLPKILFVALLFLWAIGNSFLYSQKKPAGGSEKPEKKQTTKTEKIITEKEEGDPPPAENLSELEKLFQKELDANAAPGERPPQEPVSWGWQILRTLFTLAVLLTVFYFFYRLYLFKKKVPLSRSTAFKMLQEFPLQPGRNLNVVDMGSRILILGVSDSNIQLITEITSHDQMEQLRIDCEKDSTVDRPDFLMELTSSIRDKYRDFTSPGKKNKNSADFETLEREASMERLRSLKQKRRNFQEGEL